MAKKDKMIGRVRYVEDWYGQGEHFLFECKWEDEPETGWSLDSAFPLFDVIDGEIKTGTGDYIHYTALTKIREWRKTSITDIYFM